LSVKGKPNKLQQAFRRRPCWTAIHTPPSRRCALRSTATCAAAAPTTALFAR
jgi:hypothetical protein